MQCFRSGRSRTAVDILLRRETGQLKCYRNVTRAARYPPTCIPCCCRQLSRPSPTQPVAKAGLHSGFPPAATGDIAIGSLSLHCMSRCSGCRIRFGEQRIAHMASRYMSILVRRPAVQAAPILPAPSMLLDTLSGKLCPIWAAFSPCSANNRITSIASASQLCNGMRPCTTT
jgi:hypothetical protein